MQEPLVYRWPLPLQGLSESVALVESNCSPGRPESASQGVSREAEARVLPVVDPGCMQQRKLLSLFPLLDPVMPEAPEPAQQLKQERKNVEVTKMESKMTTLPLNLLAN